MRGRRSPRHERREHYELATGAIFGITERAFDATLRYADVDEQEIGGGLPKRALCVRGRCSLGDEPKRLGARKVPASILGILLNMASFSLGEWASNVKYASAVALVHPPTRTEVPCLLKVG
jgi:hypothetical protein